MKSPTKTEIFEAITKVNAKPKQNLMIIELSYNTKLVLPHDAGVKVMAALADAELMEDNYGKPTKIWPLGKDTLRTAVLGHQYYEDIKVAQLLGITPEQLNELRAPTPETEPA
jgi:hypothetical protein